MIVHGHILFRDSYLGTNICIARTFSLLIVAYFC
jgi:hypothetical protein